MFHEQSQYDPYRYWQSKVYNINRRIHLKVIH